VIHRATGGRARASISRGSRGLGRSPSSRGSRVLRSAGDRARHRAGRRGGARGSSALAVAVGVRARFRERLNRRLVRRVMNVEAIEIGVRPEPGLLRRSTASPRTSDAWNGTSGRRCAVPPGSPGARARVHGERGVGLQQLGHVPALRRVGPGDEPAHARDREIAREMRDRSRLRISTRGRLLARKGAPLRARADGRDPQLAARGPARMRALSAPRSAAARRMSRGDLREGRRDEVARAIAARAPRCSASGPRAGSRSADLTGISIRSFSACRIRSRRRSRNRRASPRSVLAFDAAGSTLASAHGLDRLEVVPSICRAGAAVVPHAARRRHDAATSGRRP